jgi:hypothetical protein
MKKLIVHIGYPKTATTSLQDKVFYELHKTGNINYLGITSKKTNLDIHNFFQENSYLKNANIFSSNSGFANKIKIDDTIINVLSSEGHLEKVAFSDKHSDHIGIPKKIINIFETILIELRF